MSTLPKLHKCPDCPAYARGKGGVRCKPCQADHMEKSNKERMKQKRYTKQQLTTEVQVVS